MPLVHLADMVSHAYRHRYAVGAFGVDNQNFLEGVLQAAENCRSPVVLNLIESHFKGRDLDLFVPSVVAAARQAAVPVAINFDHGASIAAAKHAIAAGCNAVMVDTSHLPFSDNWQQTREVVAMARACGVSVEGELGYVPGVEGEEAAEHPGELAYTSVIEAKTFVERTGVDCLAVSVGTVHGHMKGAPKLDYNRLAKINYYTGLADAAALSIRKNVSASRSCDYGTLVAGVRDAVREEAERCMRLWGCGGRAAEVLAQCRPWQEVEHVGLFYAADGPVSGSDASRIMLEARETMKAIPGVRNIRIGRALQPDGKYHYCWLLTLTSQSAIEVLRGHQVLQNLTDKASLSLDIDMVALDFVEI